MAWKGTKPSAFIRVVEKNLVDARRAITADAVQTVVLASPVDTGAYRANHRVSLDGEDLGYDLQAVDPSGSETIRRGATVAGQIDTPFGYAVVQNNVPYGEELENGHSKQAAHGVYGPAFVAVREKYR